jgi:hopanoid biosynthesis associated RND transporter like protein HpnN
MKPLREDTFVARALAGTARLVFHYPRLIVYSHALLFVLSIWYTVKFLEFDMNRDDLVGGNKRYQQNFVRFKKEFPQTDDLVVVVESDDVERNRQFIERLGAEVAAETNLFTDVLYKKDLKLFGAKALLFAPEPALVSLKKTLRDYLPFIQQFADATNLTTLFDLINGQFRTARRESNAGNRALMGALPMLEQIVRDGQESLELPGRPPSPGFATLFNAGPRETYITFADNRIFVLNCHALNDTLNDTAVQRLGQLVQQIKFEVPGVNAGITGSPALAHAEMTQSKHDTTLASIVSLIICALIFIYGYQETGRPVKATICLIVGLGYTLGFATLTIGHLNILTVTFVPMLIGLAIDFGVHLITRYEEELRRGKTGEAALMKAMVYTGQGIFTGAFTTAGAFLTMALTNFKGIQEMGVICGGGLLICMVPMMTLLPVLLLRGHQNVIDHQAGMAHHTRARIESIWLERPVWVCAVTVGLSWLAWTQIDKVQFDYDLRDMQSAGLPAVQFEKMLINAGSELNTTNGKGRSVLFAAVVAKSPADAAKLEERIRRLSSVADVDTITNLNEDQTVKLRLIDEIKQELSGIHFGAPDTRPVDIPELSRTLYSLYGYLGAALEGVGTNEPALSRQFVSLREAIEEFRKRMWRGNAADREATAKRLARFQQEMFGDVRDTFGALQHQDTSGPLRVSDLPAALRHRFVGETGKILLQVYPRRDIWDRKNQKEFIDQLRTIDPDVTGTPVQLYEYTDLLRRSYEQAAKYALGAIVLLVFLHFRNLSSVVLALMPVVIGAVWMEGLMGFFHIELNPANIMTLPLVIGIGVTNGIHILNRFAEEQHPSILARSTGKAVFVSGLTAIAGFGSLMLAKHQGIRSLGYVMSIGMTTCMIAALTFLPAVLSIILRHGQRDKTAHAPAITTTPAGHERK